VTTSGAANGTTPTVRRIVTTRSGGVSAVPFDSFNLGGGVGDDPAAVEANRARLAAAAGLSPGRVVWMQQVHSTRVVPVDGPGPLPGTDGIVTSRRDLALAVLVADCVPILAVDPTAGVIGAAHAGRIGAAHGIGPELITTMVDAGADPTRLQILLGPAICGRCYEVPPDMQDDVESSLPGSACDTADGTNGLDLRAGLAAQFVAAGVPTVVVDQRCTREDPDLFSHRRSGRTGRQAGLIWMPGN
jgi:YfiH family protein